MPDIYLEGSVGAPFWPEQPFFTAKDVRDALNKAGGEDVTIYLNSGGGVATDGLAIYHTLNDYAGAVHIVVMAEAASAASLLAMAGDTITMRTGSEIMIHDPAFPWTEGRGTEDDHRAIADTLGKMSEGYAAIYARRAGISTEQARAIMRAETWFMADEAVAAGFATATDEAPAVAASAFPYHVYRNTPRHLLGGARAKGPGRQAVLAMIGGGVPATTAKGSAMTPEEEEAARLAAEGEDTTPAAVEDEDLPEGDDMPEGDPAPEGEDDDEEPPVDAETATAIIDLVALHSGTLDQAREFIGARMTLPAVIAHYRQKGNTVPKPNAAGASTRIIRDERETRRAGMTEALAAQFLRRDPTDGRARAFMGLSLAEMAAQSNGVRTSLRTTHDRLRVFTMDGGMHTTSDFPLALSNALNKALAARYAEAEPLYRRVGRQITFRDFRSQSVIRAGDFPALQKLEQGGEIKFGTIGESAETILLETYAIGVRISRQTLVNDDTGAIADAIADQGRSVVRREEALFFAACFAGGVGPTLSNTRAVFNTTDGTRAGTAAAITVASVGEGRAGIRKHTSVDGAKLNLNPKLILVSPDKETEAEQLVAGITPATAATANPFSGKLEVLSTAQLSGNGWYLLADPGDAALFNYGFLDGASGPSMRMEDLFGVDGMAYRLVHDFGVGATGRVGGWYNAGA